MDDSAPDEFPEEVARLGPPIAVFRVGGRRRFLFQFGAVSAILIGLAGIVAIIGLIAFAPGKNMHFGVFKIAILFLFLVGSGIEILRRAGATRGLSVVFARDGLASVQGGRVVALPWADVNAVRFSPKAHLNGARSIILIGRDGAKLELEELLGPFKEMKRIVEEQTMPNILPAARDAVISEAVVPFGAIAVSLDGLHHGKNLLLWEDLKKVTSNRGVLKVESRKKWAPFCLVDYSEIKNPHVLTELIEELRKLDREEIEE